MHRERMEENFDVFDFELSADEVAAISGLDRGEDGRTGPNPDTLRLRAPLTSSHRRRTRAAGHPTRTRTSLETWGPSVSRTRNLFTPDCAVCT